MIGKFVCLLAVLAIVAHAVDTDIYANTHNLAEVGPESVALTELASEVALKDVHKTFAFEDEEEDDEKDDFDTFEEEERKRRRMEKRREARNKQRSKRQQPIPGPVYNDVNGTNANATAATNGTATNSTRRKFVKGKFPLTARDRNLLKKAKKLDRKAKMFHARADMHEANVRVLRAVHQENKMQQKISRDNGNVEQETKMAMDAINHVRNSMESDDLRDDKLFWDQFYGKKKNTTGPAPAKAGPAVEGLEMTQEEHERKDLAMPLYKAAHIASYDETIAKASKIKKLDAELQRDGDLYLRYVQQYN